MSAQHVEDLKLLFLLQAAQQEKKSCSVSFGQNVSFTALQTETKQDYSHKTDLTQLKLKKEITAIRKYILSKQNN